MKQYTYTTSDGVFNASVTANTHRGALIKARKIECVRIPLKLTTQVFNAVEYHNAQYNYSITINQLSR